MTRLGNLNLNLILTVLGGVILVTLLFGLGLRQVLEHLRQIGVGWVFIIGQETLPILANTAGWHYAFPRDHRIVKFWRLLKMRLAGDGLNYLVPTGTVGGEIWRFNSLRQDIPAMAGAASVTLAKFNQFLGQALFIVLGLLLAAPFASLKPELVHWLWGGLAGCLLLLGLVFWGLLRGLFGKMSRCLGTWLPVRLRPYLQGDRLEELDGYICAYLLGNRRAFWASIGLFSLAWALGSLEVFLIFHFMGLPIDPATAVTVETLSIFLDMVLFFIPAKLGTQEGGKVLIFMILGLSPVAGLSFGLVRRIRELTWAGVGLACLGAIPAPQSSNQGSTDRI